MKKFFLVALIVLGSLLSASVYSFENQITTLNNDDSKTYEYIIKTACDRNAANHEMHGSNGVIYDCGIYYGKIDSHSRVAICNFGCELTLPDTEQTIAVKEGDTVVIDKGVLKRR
jgi:hypothetical protein